VIMDLFVDIESYSDVDLTKAGLYKYAQSPAFRVLLVSYSFDGGPVKVVDVAQGEAWPQELLGALWSPVFTKHAYNAAFEWYCLSKYFKLSEKDTLDWIPQWRDTMLQVSYCGYPNSLDAAGKALGLSSEKQKMSVGKALIRYFCIPCKPTKTNGGRTRNLPQHDPDKWTLFKEYNCRDVETEMAIEHRLAAFPVPDDVQKQWETDLRINARGVAVDLDLVDGALAIDAAERERLEQEAIQLTGLDNPNSVAQLKDWLEAETDAEVADLRKDTVKDLLGGDIPGDKARRVLEIRQELGKTSTKKYAALETATCADSRVRGILQFYGANRTGRWCLTGDHEVLTEDGWQRLDGWAGGKILCWSPTMESLSFQKSDRVQFEYKGPMITFTGQRIEQIATPEHKMAVLGKDGRWEAKEVSQLTGRFTIPFTGKRPTRGSGTGDELRVLIMTQADGHYTADGCVRYHFVKQRKIERCKRLLRRAGIPFMTDRYGTASVIRIPAQCVPLWLRQFRDKTFGYWLMDEDPAVLFEELCEWDGYRGAPNSIQYTSTNEQNVDVLQACALCAGLSATKIRKHRTKDNWNDTHVLNIWLTPGRGTAIRKEQIGAVNHEGPVYCAVTPTGYFAVRRNGKVWITGNSGRMVQPQNLPRTYISGDLLPLARDLVKTRQTDALRWIFGSVPDTLSQLIRTALVASPGHVLVDADFSAIEARVLAWLAGEEWRLEVFRTHGKIYEASASQMFGVPMEKIKKGNPEYELRQRGKVAELALGYGGGVAAMRTMDTGKILAEVPDEEIQEIVNAWRLRSPAITRLWTLCETAALSVARSGSSTAIPGAGLVFAYEYDPNTGLQFMTIQLPSGRKLYYPEPSIGTNRFGRESVTYWGVNQTTRKWMQLETYGGKLVENITQAVARDCLAEAVERLEAAGYPVVFHVHDEVVIDARTDCLEQVVEIMKENPSWAKGLPLNADGWTDAYYKKD